MNESTVLLYQLPHVMIVVIDFLQTWIFSIVKAVTSTHLNFYLCFSISSTFSARSHEEVLFCFVFAAAKLTQVKYHLEMLGFSLTSRSIIEK